MIPPWCVLRRTAVPSGNGLKNEKSFCKEKAMRFRMAFLTLRQSISAIAAAVVALLVAVLVGLAICLLVVILVAIRRDIPMVSMLEIAVVRRTVAVPAAPLVGSVFYPVLIAVLPRCIKAITTIAAAAISAAITVAIVVPIPVAASAIVAALFAEPALVS